MCAPYVDGMASNILHLLHGMWPCNQHSCDAHRQGGCSCLHAAATCTTWTSPEQRLEVVKYLCVHGDKELMVLKDNKGVSPLSAAEKKQDNHVVVEYLKSVGMTS